MLKLLPLLLLVLVARTSCFVVPFQPPTRSISLLATKTTLTDATTWKLRFFLKGIPTEKGKKIESMFAMEARFLEDIDYEPPQGSVTQIVSNDTEGDDRILEIANGRWKLSEDPNERKDGLWVWGLFKEPLYPFMLLQLETKRVVLPGEENDAILPLKLFAQINHSRDKEKGVLLSNAELNVRVMETVKADPFGGATVDIYDEVSVGQISIQAL